jgi:hypothetical protein
LAEHNSSGNDDMNDDLNDDIITEEMLWERIPETQGIERASTYY